jgi:Txe/YoeB family toxin of Txe-Axe toxin-antitoxin module
MSKRVPRYRVEWTEEAWAEVHLLKVFERRPVMQAAEELAHEAETETQNRKPLREPLEELPEATWEVRIQAKHRLLYCVYRVEEGENEQKTVEILRAIIKDRESTTGALRRKR